MLVMNVRCIGSNNALPPPPIPIVPFAYICLPCFLHIIGVYLLFWLILDSHPPPLPLTHAVLNTPD